MKLKLNKSKDESRSVLVTYYSKSYLLERLKKAKLPFTYHTLIKYENMGIIKRPGTVLSGSDSRFYTMAEIDEIVDQIREYKNES